MNENVPPKAPDDAARRSFLMRFAAVVFGGLVALFPFLAGFGVAFDPSRRRRAAAAGGGTAPTETSGAKCVRICSLDALTAGGAPQAFPVVLDVVDDAWTRTFNQKVGMVFLERQAAGVKPEVIAFNAKCPHLGCIVDFDAKSGNFVCPCHKSAFAKDGEKLDGPSLRGMDRLDAVVKTTDGQKEVWVAFEKFLPGIAERKSAG